MSIMHTWPYPGMCDRSLIADFRHDRRLFPDHGTPAFVRSIQSWRSIAVDVFIHSRRDESVGFIQAHKASLDRMFFDRSDSTNKFPFCGANTIATKIARASGQSSSPHAPVSHRPSCRSANNNAKAAAFPAVDPRHIDRRVGIKQRDKLRILAWACRL